MANKYPVVTSPRGVLIYPHFSEPDTKFVKPDGEYHTKFALDADEASTEEFNTKLQTILDEYIAENRDELKPAAIKKAARADIFEEEIDDEGEETGRLIYKFKLKAKIKTKTKEWDQKPKLFDSQGEPVVTSVNVWTGSEAKVSVEVFPYFMQSSKTFGLSLRCPAVQILKLVEGSGGRDASAYGFGKEEGGYEDEGSAGNHGFKPEDDGEGDGEF